MTKAMMIIGIIYAVIVVIAFWVDDRLEKKAIKQAELESLKKE